MIIGTTASNVFPLTQSVIPSDIIVTVNGARIDSSSEYAVSGTTLRCSIRFVESVSAILGTLGNIFVGGTSEACGSYGVSRVAIKTDLSVLILKLTPRQTYISPTQMA